jgi:hypothetical protein
VRRLVAVMALVALLCAGSGAMAQSEPSAAVPWFGGRAELPEHGFAVVVPDGAVAYDMTGDLQSQLHVVVPDASDEDIAAWSAAMRERLHGQLVLAFEESTCGFVVGPTIGTNLASEVDEFFDRQTADESVVHLESPRVVELPAAEARLVTYGRIGEEAAFYLGEKDGVAFDIWCAGAERPDDDWLSVAAAFEWLPVPVQRVATPRQGASIEVPTSWDVMTDVDFLPDARLSSSSGLRVTDWLRAGAAQSGESCSVFVWTPGPDVHVELDAEVAGLLADYGVDTGIDILTPVPEPILFPAGSAVRLRVVSDEGRPPAGITYIDTYFIARDGVLVDVGCSGPDPHHDRWLSIAETLEFAPVEE